MPISDTAPAPASGFEPRIGRSVSLDHAAQLLGVSRRTIYNRIREGRLQTIRTLGGSQRVLLDSVGPSNGFGEDGRDAAEKF
jgi:excisionase family DNA binding protein